MQQKEQIELGIGINLPNPNKDGDSPQTAIAEAAETLSSFAEAVQSPSYRNTHRKSTGFRSGFRSWRARVRAKEGVPNAGTRERHLLTEPLSESLCPRRVGGRKGEGRGKRGEEDEGAVEPFRESCRGCGEEEGRRSGERGGRVLSGGDDIQGELSVLSSQLASFIVHLKRVFVRPDNIA